jgi:5'/3'-nucleotidase SurE
MRGNLQRGVGCRHGVPIAVDEFSPGNFSVDGRPAVATMTALDDLFAGQEPDLVISGTNRGDNIGESENISGTVNGAIQALFDGIPSIAVSAGSVNGDFTNGFNNAAAFIVDLVEKLEAAQTPGAPLLPPGEGLTVNVPGSAVLDGVAVTDITQESNGSFPTSMIAPGQFAETFVPPAPSSGSTTAEGAQFLLNRVTVTPIDGTWGATLNDRAALEARIGPLLDQATPAAQPLNIMLINDDGAQAPGITAVRDALLAKGYNVTLIAPATDQSGTGSALTLATVTVTQFAANEFSANASPATIVETSLDAILTGANRPDLIVSGANRGANVGIETSNHSGTLGAAITALFNYQVPSIALSTGTDQSGDVPAGLYDLSADFLTKVIADLQATEGTGNILPRGLGLDINVPVGASETNHAFTMIDAATNSDISVAASATPGQAQFKFGGPVTTGNPFSEGDAFNAGKITISPIDGNFSSTDFSAYQSIADLLGTDFGAPTTLSTQTPVFLQSISTGQLIQAVLRDGTFLGFELESNPLAGITHDWLAGGFGEVTKGPGGPEIFVQNQTDGTVGFVSNDHGSPVIGGLTPALGALGTGFKLVGAGDLDHDGSADAILQDQALGTIVYANELNGQFVGFGAVDASTALGATWKVVGAGDINGDGFADVVIQNQSQGEILFQNMAGGAGQGYQPVVGNASLGADWKVVGVGDINRDGFADVVIQQATTGSTIYADMAHGQFSGFDPVTNSIDSTFKVVGIADVNQDGFADVIFQHTTDGQVVFADMHGGAFTQFGAVTAPLGHDWLVV